MINDFLINKEKPERCSTNPFCPNLGKIKGIYHCLLTNEDIDGGDEEDGSDYIFNRTTNCLKKEILQLKKQLAEAKEVIKKVVSRKCGKYIDSAVDEYLYEQQRKIKLEE